MKGNTVRADMFLFPQNYSTGQFTNTATARSSTNIIVCVFEKPTTAAQIPSALILEAKNCPDLIVTCNF